MMRLNRYVNKRKVIGLMRLSTRIDDVVSRSSSTIGIKKTILNKDRLHESMREVMINDITMARVDTASMVVSWFMNQMPASYFKQIPEDMRRQHLLSIAAIQDLNQNDLTLKLQTPGVNDAIEVTYITSGCKEGLLFSQIDGLEIPADHYLSNVKVYSSMDEKLSLNVFTFDHVNYMKSNFANGNEATVSSIMKYIEEIKVAKHDNYMQGKLSLPKYSDIYSKSQMLEYFKVIPHSYLANVRDYRRFLIIRSLYHEVQGTENVAVHVDKFKDPTNSANEGAWISIATPNLLPEKMLKLVSRYMSSKNMKIRRAHLDNFLDHKNSVGTITSYVTMLRLLVSPDPSQSLDNNELNRFIKDLKRTKWLDDEVINMGLFRHPTMGIEKAEIIVALCSMLHGPLSKQNSQEYASIKTVISVLEKSPHFMVLANDIAKLFLDRFNPEIALTDGKFEQESKALKVRISELHLESARTLLLKMLEAVESTLRTNFFNDDRYALSLRVKPTIMTSNNPSPFGVFFAHGRNFNAFHCRFRDIARGGLRIVTPTNSDQHALESSRQFDEAYGLSYAQQLKNKDIAEGGSKGVILVNPNNINAKNKDFQVRKSVKV